MLARRSTRLQAMPKTTPDTFQAVSIARSIAPTRQVDLGASDASTGEWQGIDSDVEANMLALWTPGDPTPMLFVTLDLLYPGQRIRAAIERAAEEVPADRIVVAASHTHRAPMTDSSKPVLGSPDEEYMTWLTAELSAMVRTVLGSPRVPVTVSAGDAVAAHSINRRLRKRVVVARRPRLNDFVNAPNPEGQTDERLTAMILKNADAEPVAVVWNYACHPVGGPVKNAVSSHYPGVVRDRVRRDLSSPDLPVLFFQGFSGDVRPNASTKVHSVRRRLRQMISGRLFEDMTWASYERWSVSLSEVLTMALRDADLIPVSELISGRVVLPASRIARGDGLGVISFATLKIGEAITIHTMSGEPVVDYALHAREVTPSRFVLCVGCADQVVGYVPTRLVQAEGGYEGGGFAKAFGLEGLQDRVEDVVEGAFRMLADTTESRVRQQSTPKAVPLRPETEKE